MRENVVSLAGLVPVARLSQLSEGSYKLHSLTTVRSQATWVLLWTEPVWCDVLSPRIMMTYVVGIIICQLALARLSSARVLMRDLHHTGEDACFAAVLQLFIVG